jgi:integrase/recombinase XerD
MTTAAPSVAIATIQPAFTDAERIALAGFLAGYRGLTREAYALDLRQFASWCRGRSLALLSVRRADIEGFARDLEAMGRARATITRRLSTIAGFYKYAVEEELLDRSPAAHVRRPESIMSRMPWPWIAMSSARCWWRPGSDRRPGTR